MYFIVSTVLLAAGAAYLLMGERIEKSKFLRNLDMSFEGLIKAVGILIVSGCISIGVQLFMPVTVSNAIEVQDIAGLSQVLTMDSAEAVQNHELDGTDTSETLQVEAEQINDEIQIENEEVIVNENQAGKEDQASAALDTGLYVDGTYQGTARGFRGDITTEVQVVDGKIASVEVVSQREDRKWFNRANQVIPNSIIEAQSTDVDVVSGATYSSLGIIESVAEALAGHFQ